MPITPNDIDVFVQCWKTYDNDAKGFIAAEKLDALFQDLAEAQCEMIAFKSKLVRDPAYRRRFIASLEIPTFREFSQFMFYDVLQTLCQPTCENHYNAEKIQERKEKLRIVKMLQGQTMTEADLALHAAALTKDEYATDFSEIVANMRKLDPRIELFSTLKSKSAAIGKKYSRGIDKVKLAGAGGQAADIYTSAHYVYGTYIVKKWRAALRRRRGSAGSRDSSDGGHSDGDHPGTAKRTNGDKGARPEGSNWPSAEAALANTEKPREGPTTMAQLIGAVEYRPEQSVGRNTEFNTTSDPKKGVPSQARNIEPH